MSRLPVPGSDAGNWGTILNDYLSQVLKSDGTLKDNVVTGSSIAPDAVTSTEIADGTIAEAQLGGAVQAKLNQAPPTWTTISGKPVVVAAGADQVAARTAITAAPLNIGDITNRVNPRATPELWATFADKSNGSAPTRADSGQPMSATGAALQVVENGRLIAHTTGIGGGGYFVTVNPLNDYATRIGGRFILTGGSTNTGGIALAITNVSLGSLGGAIPDMSCHFVITATNWAYGVWAGPNNGNGGLSVIATSTFSDPLVIDGKTEYEAEAWINGNTATIQVRDALNNIIAQKTFSDSRIDNTSYKGRHVFFESAGSATDNEAGFTHVWASSGLSKPAQYSTKQWRITKQPTATTTDTFGTNNVSGLSGTFIAPNSGTVVITATVCVHVVTATAFYLGTITADGYGSGGNQYQLMFDSVSGGSNNYRTLTAQFIHSNLTPGALHSFAVNGIAIASDLQIMNNHAAHLRNTVVVEPTL